MLMEIFCGNFRPMRFANSSFMQMFLHLEIFFCWPATFRPFIWMRKARPFGSVFVRNTFHCKHCGDTFSSWQRSRLRKYLIRVHKGRIRFLRWMRNCRWSFLFLKIIFFSSLRAVIRSVKYLLPQRRWKNGKFSRLLFDFRLNISTVHLNRSGVMRIWITRGDKSQFSSDETLHKLRE